MKIKAAVVEKQNADFTIKDDIELAPMGADDIQRDLSFRRSFASWRRSN